MVPRRTPGPIAPPSRDRVTLALTVTAGLLALTIFGYLAHLRPPQSHLWGDEGTYVAMTASLVRDGDLAFTESDRDWAGERGAFDEAESGKELPQGPKGVTVILQRTEAGITYSKPLLYPLLAALPYALLGEPGLLVLNATALAVGVLLAGLYLGRLGSGARRWLTLVTFIGCSAILPYLAWRMGEAVQVGLALSGLTLACGGLHRSGDGAGESAADGRGLLDRPRAPWIGGGLLGLLTAMRASNSLLLAGALLACLLIAGRKRLLAVAGGAAVSITLVLSASQIALGTASPYTAERASFNARIGYPVGPDAAAALTRFDHKPATHRPRLDLSPAQRYSLLYFFVGRHSGLLAYFPLALAMIYLLIRRPSRLGLVMLATAAALATFYLLYTPHNYFGGSTFISNRYFLVAYPALLIGLRELPSTRILIATLGVGLVFATSAVGSVRRTRDLDHSSQSHAAAGAFRRLPYETTARHIQGQRYRFWSGDYLRFTDAFATVQRRRFLLHSDRPHTELMIARSQVPPRMVFFVRPAELAGRLAYRSAAGIGWNRPASLDPERPGVVAIETERTWRQHPLGWSSRAVYDLRILELKLDPGGGEGEPRQAEVYYLGRDAAALDAFAAEVVSSEIPEAGSAGGRGVARLEVRNTGPMIWSPEDVLPVTAGYRVLEGEAVVSTGKGPIERTVGPGATAVFEVGIDWPAKPGDYRLVLDLEQHPIERLEAAERAVAVRARR